MYDIYKGTPGRANCKFLMTNRSKLLSESECNKVLKEGHYRTSRNKYERGKKAMKIYGH